MPRTSSTYGQDLGRGRWLRPEESPNGPWLTASPAGSSDSDPPWPTWPCSPVTRPADTSPGERRSPAQHRPGLGAAAPDPAAQDRRGRTPRPGPGDPRVLRPLPLRGGRVAILWPNHLDWLTARGYEYLSFPGPVSVEFADEAEAVRIDRSCPAEALAKIGELIAAGPRMVGAPGSSAVTVTASRRRCGRAPPRRCAGTGACRPHCGAPGAVRAAPTSPPPPRSPRTATPPACASSGPHLGRSCGPAPSLSRTSVPQDAGIGCIKSVSATCNPRHPSPDRYRATTAERAEHERPAGNPAGRAPVRRRHFS
jgi:hypothetical protein